MAIKQVARKSVHSTVVFEAFMEYDDTDYRVTNDDGEPDDYRVIRWFGQNHSAYPFRIEILLPSGRNWKEYTLAPGQQFSVNAGGQVKYEFDVPEWRYG